ncbi:uncharacterized protein G2W53_041355 [Senna tora]|uniref:Uncharacterized protein n=1 Tax=Senna tora TaxID=362788 RepID=A0A834SJU2_9FABA|nr:uncharacterized protein G2W53_041343 [Senna tora]KAF7802244.1 uncharacterized protein G2W53_041355 [Senna tora]
MALTVRHIIHALADDSSCN